MARLEELQVGQRVKGIVPGDTVEVVALERPLADVVLTNYRAASGRTAEVAALSCR